MAAPTLCGGSGLAKGDCVYFWSANTQQVDQDGVIDQVLDVAKPNDGLPAGSLCVKSLDGTTTLWVQPQFVGMVLKRKDRAVAPMTAGDAASPLGATMQHLGSAALGGAPLAAPAAGGHAYTRPEPEEIPTQRRDQRVLIIGAGFGVELNPAQFRVVQDAGFNVRILKGLPNPETVQFPVEQYMPQIVQGIEDFRPHAVACASKGVAYMVALWQRRLWRGPSLVINKHPTLLTLPKDVSVVLCHGSNDEYYQYRREDLEAIVRSGSPNHCLLYYTGNSGLLGRVYTREGDKHNMASLVQYDCLPRLLDAAMSAEGPELGFMRSWRAFLTQERRDAEAWLGWNTQDLRRRWESADQKGMDDQILFEVHAGSEEHAMLSALFYAQPTVPRAYHDMNPGMWQGVAITKIERVENGLQEDGNLEPYFKSLRRGIENQGMKFEPFVHTTWAFHGSSAVEEIVTNPISGFQPLMSGSRAASLWGPGTYFARDAKYVFDGGFCNVLPDGSRQLFLCLLMTGMPCLGDPKHPGILPVRCGRHRYNSSVDSLSNPEIWVTQSPGAAYPAYIITFH